MIFKSTASICSTLCVLVFMLLAHQPSFADSRVTIASTSKLLTPPTGFQEVENHKYYGRAFFESILPSNSRLLEAYISENDFLALESNRMVGIKRYMMAMTNEETESTTFTRPDFAEIADETITSHNQLYEEIQAEINKDLEGASDRMSEQLDQKIDVGVQQITPLQGASRTVDSVSTQVIAKYDAVSQGKSITFKVASSNSLVLLGEKVIILTVLSEYQDPTDIDWVRKTSEMWISDLLTANAQQ